MPQMEASCVKVPKDSELEREFSLTSVQLQLEPFLDQVGGHSSLLCLEEGTLCKPLVARELQFYENMPHSLHKFTPQYRGVIQVRFIEEPDGYIRFDTYAPKFTAPQPPPTPTRPHRNGRVRLKKSGSIDIQSDHHEKGESSPKPTVSKMEVDLREEGNLEHALERRPSMSVSIPVGGHSNRKLHNPWAAKCQKSHLHKLTTALNYAQNFLLLENMTRRFESPCVLDLKMGTQQHGDDAPPDKIQKKREKAVNSTSIQLGVRICGMQVYQSTRDSFLCRDKYYGQKLDVAGFEEELALFLHNGERLRLDALAALLKKLKALREVLFTLDTFRFYTSSLLLVYEGKQHGAEGAFDESQVEVRMIDFAHSGCCVDSPEYLGVDTGYLFGLCNLIHILDKLLEQSNNK